MDEEALRKRRERQMKQRKESLPIPNIYGDQQGDSEDDDEPQGSKRRSSKVYGWGSIAKTERAKKAHEEDLLLLHQIFLQMIIMLKKLKKLRNFAKYTFAMIYKCKYK